MKDFMGDSIKDFIDDLIRNFIRDFIKVLVRREISPLPSRISFSYTWGGISTRAAKTPPWKLRI